jgi:predicted transcriptional regulator
MNYLKATENTVTIVSAFLSNNIVPASDVPDFIGKVHQAITGLRTPEVALTEKQEPAVSIRTSVKPDHIVCLECGEKHKILRRHINAAHNMTEHEYRAKWNLPSDYPLVAPNYSEKRRGLAIQNGLGRKAKG